MKILDFTLYNRVKAKFPPQPGTVILVSLAPENLDELQGTSFTIEKFEELQALACKYEEQLIPYAAIGGYDDKRVEFDFSCYEFQQVENLLTGKIIASSLGTYRKGVVTLEDVKRDLQKLGSNLDLVGNA